MRALDYKESERRTLHMKKRLRKKLHRDEFTEWGRRFIITRNRKDEFDEFLDAFIEIIEANGCVCGGGGMEDNLDMVIELGRQADNRDARMKNITSWLERRPDVQSWKVSTEIDLWNGNFEEISGEIVTTS